MSPLRNPVKPPQCKYMYNEAFHVIEILTGWEKKINVLYNPKYATTLLQNAFNFFPSFYKKFFSHIENEIVFEKKANREK